MRDIEALLRHGRKHRFRRRRGGRQELHRMAKPALFILGRIEDGGHHDRRAAEMRDIVVRQRVPDQVRAHPAQRHMGSRHHRNRPGETPAIAVEHRQRPEIDGMPGQVSRQHIARSHEIGAPVMIDHALGISRRARGIVQRNRLPFIGRPKPFKFRVAAGNELLVFDRAQPLALHRKFRIDIVNDDGFVALHQLNRILRKSGELLVNNQQFRFRMVQGKADGCRIKARVQGVENRPHHRHAVMAFQHRRRIGENCRNRIALLDPGLHQG